MRGQVDQKKCGRDRKGSGYLKLENLMFTALKCGLPKRNMEYCSSILHLATPWQWRRPKPKDCSENGERNQKGL